MSDLTLKDSNMSEIKNILLSTSLYEDVVNLILEYAKKIEFNIGDVIFNRDGEEGLNIHYIIQGKTKNYYKMVRCRGWYSIPLKDLIQLRKKPCDCTPNCRNYVYEIYYNHEKDGVIRQFLPTKNYFIYKYGNKLICNDLDLNIKRKMVRFTNVKDEYLLTNRHRKISPSTHILSSVDEIINDAGIYTNLKTI